MDKIKINPKANALGEAVIITPFVGFGDLLYHTPTIRILSRIYKGVDIWCFNPEPFMNNPYVHKVFKIDADTINIFPHEFYFDFCFHVSGEQNHFIQNLYPSNVYSPDYYSLAIIHCTLPDEEKHLTFNWKVTDEISVKVKAKGFLNDTNFTVAINPAIGWPSRTLPYEYYHTLIARILELGDTVFLIGKEVDPQGFMPSQSKKGINETFKRNETKSLYTFEDLKSYENLIDLTNQFTLAECAAFYSMVDMAINTENGNMVISNTNDQCWNLYIPTLTAPQYRIPFRNGSQSYRTTIVHNKSKHYPGSDFKQLRMGYDYIRLKVDTPDIEDTWKAYLETRNHILLLC